MIVISGATGNIGRATISQLTRQQVALRAIIRSAEKANVFSHTTVESAIADLADSDSLDRVLSGASAALLVSPIDTAMVALQENFIEAARRIGNIHIVKISGLGTAPDSPLQSGRWHAQIERRLEASGLPYTHLRPPFFMQNMLRFAPAVADHGELAAPMKDGTIAMVDVYDIAAVAAKALTDTRHAGKTYTVTGPAALSFHQIASRLSIVTGKTVTYRDIDLKSMRQRLQDNAMPDWHIDILMQFWTVLREGYGSPVTDTVATVTGTAARSFSRFAQTHAALFNGISAPRKPA